MLFQVRTDNHIPNNEALQDRVQAEVEGTLLPRFADRLQRVEVYLQDVNGHKGGIDKRCAIQAHLAGHQPVTAETRAVHLDDAVRGAVDRLTRALEHTIGRLNDREGRVSASGEST